jgi:hypothetical protein
MSRTDECENCFPDKHVTGLADYPDCACGPQCATYSCPGDADDCEWIGCYSCYEKHRDEEHGGTVKGLGYDLGGES